MWSTYLEVEPHLGLIILIRFVLNVSVLQIPEEIVIPMRRYRVPGFTALCILLKRLAYPNRLRDLEATFGMTSSALSSVVQYMVSHFVERKGHLLSHLENHVWLNSGKLANYAAVWFLCSCWSFQSILKFGKLYSLHLNSYSFDPTPVR